VTPEIGQLALIIALSLALIQGVFPIAGAARGDAVWTAMARPVALGQFGFVALAFACLTYSFVANDFSVLYVANHSNSLLPVQYRVAAVWGGHEGSLLLWTLLLAGWTAAVAMIRGPLPHEVTARVIGVMGLLSVGFLLFLLFTSNPFERLVPAAMDGRDLNPLLQDIGLIIHPPMLYMGYVGFSVAFAFAIAALLGGRLDSTWARWSRPWTVTAWALLTLGIALGSWWAYYELGWGGWWFWDPVENASFMPWLVGTALIHSLIATEKRGSFNNWTVLLAILTFSLSLLGTFLVRSGVLTSVHAFATDPTRGVFILAFLLVVVGGSLLLYAWRAPQMGRGGSFGWFSRESLLLANNVLFTVAAATVLLGTLYPLLLDALGAGKLSVGPPYFDSVFVPLMVPMVLLMGVVPFARWKQASVSEIFRRLRWTFVVALAAALLLPLALGRWSPMIAMGLMMAIWITLTDVQDWIGRARTTRGGFFAIPLSVQGMHVAHLGVAIFIVGVTLVGGYQDEKDVRMDVGDTVEVGGYTFRFDGTEAVQGPNYTSQMGSVVVSKNGEPLFRLRPEKRSYTTQTMSMTEAAIHTSPLRDLYVSLGSPLEGGAWSVRVYSKPFVIWIWGGCATMAIGGVLALSDRRYRIASKKRNPAKGVAGKQPSVSGNG
jgi:cytochrome c-type biogenesis protein CcmF